MLAFLLTLNITLGGADKRLRLLRRGRGQGQNQVPLLEEALARDIVEAQDSLFNNDFGRKTSTSLDDVATVPARSRSGSTYYVQPILEDQAVDDVEVIEVKSLDASELAQPLSRSGPDAPQTDPIPIVRSFNNAPGMPGFERSFGYAFEAANGIKQQADGELKRIGGAEVMVMKGSYEYIGSDGLTYVVDWYADETGFHPSAPHLPKNVPIPYPEQAEAVEAQIRFANNEVQSVAASTLQVSTQPQLEPDVKTTNDGPEDTYGTPIAEVIEVIDSRNIPIVPQVSVPTSPILNPFLNRGLESDQDVEIVEVDQITTPEQGYRRVIAPQLYRRRFFF